MHKLVLVLSVLLAPACGAGLSFNVGFGDAASVPAGDYEVILYAMTPGDAAHPNRLRVDFGSPGPVMCGGAWAGFHQDTPCHKVIALERVRPLQMDACPDSAHFRGRLSALISLSFQ